MMTAPDLPQVAPKVVQARATARAKYEWLVLPLLLGGGCAALVLIAASNDRWHEVLDYRRSAVASGELWRLITAHLMHVNAAHAVLDIAGLWLVAWIFAREFDAKRQALALAIGAAFVDFGLWFFHPEVERYVGLSGALHALFAAGVMHWLVARPASDAGATRRTRRTWGAVLLIGLVAKLVLEEAGDAFWLQAARFDVVTAAHRWGSVGGALVGVVAARMRPRA